MKRVYRVFLFVSWATLSAWVPSQAAAQGDAGVDTAVRTAREAGVPEQTLNHILALGYRHNLEAQDVARFLFMAREASEEGLPLDPLVGKMEEGLAKQIQIQTIERAVRNEMGQYRFVLNLTHMTMARHNMRDQHLVGKDLTKMTKALSMGLNASEMETFFKEAPRASMRAYANALELTSAMKQSGLEFSMGKEIAFNGLEKGYFARSAWALALTVHIAKKGGLEDARIRDAALAVVTGSKSIRSMQESLHIDPKNIKGRSHDVLLQGLRSGETGRQTGNVLESHLI